MPSRLVITFLPRSKCLNFMAAVTICSDFGAQNIINKGDPFRDVNTILKLKPTKQQAELIKGIEK